MSLNNFHRFVPIVLMSLILTSACNGPSPTVTDPAALPSLEPVEENTPNPTSTLEPPTKVAATPTQEISHILEPAEPLPGKVIYDVVSETTGSDKRAPYGDSYDLNLLERPFLQDMTYIPDLDIFTFSIVKDDNFWYVSVKLVGADPNNSLGINYGLDLDTNNDGFGDFIIWAHPPYSTEWESAPVKIFEDTNHDTSGLSSEISDAPFAGDGYETLVFNGGQGDIDPDIAWIRIHESYRSTLQFAFKREWSGMFFMLGVMADAGLRDVGQQDYVDRFEEQEAGSPVREKAYYPLGNLFAFDNTCREPLGIVKRPTGFEPRLCPLQPAPPRP